MKRTLLILIALSLAAFFHFCTDDEAKGEPFFFVEKYRAVVGFSDFKAQMVYDDADAAKGFSYTFYDCTLGADKLNIYAVTARKIAEETNEMYAEEGPHHVSLKFFISAHEADSAAEQSSYGFAFKAEEFR